MLNVLTMMHRRLQGLNERLERGVPFCWNLWPTRFFYLALTQMPSNRANQVLWKSATNVELLRTFTWRRNSVSWWLDSPTKGAQYDDLICVSLFPEWFLLIFWDKLPAVYASTVYDFGLITRGIRLVPVEKFRRFKAHCIDYMNESNSNKRHRNSNRAALEHISCVANSASEWKTGLTWEFTDILLN